MCLHPIEVRGWNCPYNVRFTNKRVNSVNSALAHLLITKSLTLTAYFFKTYPPTDPALSAARLLQMKWRWLKIPCTIRWLINTLPGGKKKHKLFNKVEGDQDTDRFQNERLVNGKVMPAIGRFKSTLRIKDTQFVCKFAYVSQHWLRRIRIDLYHTTTSCRIMTLSIRLKNQ